MRPRTALLAALFLTLAAAPVARAGWLHQENAVFQAEKEIQKHPKSVGQVLVLPRAAAEPKICVAYTRNTTVKKDGKVVTKVAIEDGDGGVRNFKLVARVRDNRAIKCRDLEDQAAGTTFRFEHSFKKMPRVRTVNGARQSVVVTGILSTLGQPGIADDALVLVPASGAAPLGLDQGRGGGWFHSANSVFHAERDGEKHPETLSRVIMMPYKSSRRPLVCAAYDRSPQLADTGTGSARARIARADGSIERLRLSASVRDDSYVSCQEAERRIAPGDLISFEATYEGMPALENGTFADLIVAVSSVGEPRFPARPRPKAPKEEEPAEESGEEDPGSGGGGDPAPPPSGGSITIADEYATARIMAGLKNQLHLQRNYVPKKWLVIGPRSALGGDGNLIESTVGYGSSIASALADYERKQGSLGGTARRLTPAERSAIEYYSRMAPVGPTGIRKDGRHEYHGDVYRTWLGLQFSGPLPSLAAVVDWMKSIGL